MPIRKPKKKFKLHFKKFSKKIKSKDITLFTRQTATLLKAGIPLAQTLSILSKSTTDQILNDLIRKIKMDIESGSAFSKALRKYPAYFDELYCSLIESGEQSGTLDTVLDSLSFYKEKSDSLKEKVKKALYYPLIVTMVATIITLILLIKVIPTFKEMFKGYGAPLPLFTQFVLNISDFLQCNGFYILMGLIIPGHLLHHFYRKKIRFQQLGQKAALNLPIFGPILKKTIIARFARTLSTTTTAGVPLTDALGSIAKASYNIVYLTAIEKMKEGLHTGETLQTMMKKSNAFPPMVVQMIGIGEESGTLENMLEKIAVIYEEEVDVAVNGLTTLLEPLMMIIMGILVGGLVIAMYLPIFKMGSIV